MFAVLATSYAEAPLPYAPAGGPGGFSEGLSGLSTGGSHGFSDFSSNGFSDSVSVSAPGSSYGTPAVAPAPAPVYGAPHHQNVHHHETVEVIEGHANLPPPRTEVVKNVHIHKVQRILEPYPVHVDRTVIKTKHIDRPYPQPVEVIKPVPQPYHVDVVKEVIKHISVSDDYFSSKNKTKKKPKINSFVSTRCHNHSKLSVNVSNMCQLTMSSHK